MFQYFNQNKNLFNTKCALIQIKAKFSQLNKINLILNLNSNNKTFVYLLI